MVGEDDDRLEDLGLSRQSGGSKDGVVLGYLSPSEDTEAEALCDLCEDSLVLLERCGVSGLEEDVANCILA